MRGSFKMSNKPKGRRDSNIASFSPRFRASTVLIAILTLLHTTRLTSWRIAWNAYKGNLPLVLVIPGIGDVLAGLTAPLVAYRLLRSRTQGSWTTALVWHAVAWEDFVVGQSMLQLVPGGKKVFPKRAYAFIVPLF